MEASSSQIVNDDIFIKFKFGGDWILVKNENRRRYDGGKQKSVKVEKDKICYFYLKAEIERICPWLRGCNYDSYYLINKTSPKEYKLFTSDVEVLEMINQLNGDNHTEIVVALEEVERQDACLEFNVADIDTQLVDLSANCVEDYVSGELSTQKLVVGIFFKDALSFKHALRTDAIINNYGVRIRASDKKRVIATCSHRECQWRIRASLCEDEQTFQVRRVEGVHTCPGINKVGNRQATSSWIANEIQDIVKVQPDIPPKHINNTLMDNYGLSMPYMKLWRSREEAHEIIFGSVEENYKWVPTLAAELLKRNPGSHITYTYNSADNSFQRFYVSFKVCADGFLEGCRPLIGLDACHLKSKHLGVLLSANSLDGNNGLFTIAFAIVETESKDTWTWFIGNLGETIGWDLYPLAFISDMEKDLGDAIGQLFPNAEHRVCIRHLWKNLKKFFHCRDGQKLQNAVWSAANKYTNIEFENKLMEIHDVSPEVHSYLLSLPYKWSRSQFMLEIKHDCNTNNLAESFNSWIAAARSKPVVDLVDLIRGMIMQQRSKRKMNSTLWRGELVPHVKDYIREISTRKEHMIVRDATISKAGVEGRHIRHEVDIEIGECTCRVWQLTGLPCIHAVAFIAMKEHQLWHIYVDDHYYVQRYKIAYDGAISTLPDKSQWQVVNEEFQVGPPNTSRPRGRPRKQRFKSFMEKDKKNHKCGRCGQWGHHRSTCKNLLGTTIDVPFKPRSSQTTHSKLPIRREANDIEFMDEEFVSNDFVGDQ